MFLTAVQFHKIYTECFTNTQTIYNSDAYYTAQYELSNLLDITNKDEKIIEIMKKIRADFVDKKGLPENPTLSRFMACSANLKIGETPLKNGEAFWKMFSSSLPFDTAVPIQKLAVKRFRELQQDFQEKLKGQSLSECLSNPNFFDRPEEQANIPSTGAGGYYKEGASSNTPIGYVSNREVPHIEGNYYSEKELDRLPTAAANQARNIRDAFAQRALNGEIITDKIIIEVNPYTNNVSFSITENTNPVAQYAVTMSALVYEEIKAGRIRTRLEADDYVKTVLQSDIRFIFAFTIHGPDKFQEIVSACRGSMKYFNDAYDQYAQQSSSSSSSSRASGKSN